MCRYCSIRHATVLLTLLLEIYGVLLLADFGSSRVLDKATSHAVRRPLRSSNAYGAPETITKKTYDGLKSDIWSL